MLGAGFVRFLNPDSSPDSVLEYDAAGLLGFKGSATGGGFPRIAGLTSSQGGMFGMGPTNANYYWYGKLTVPLSADLHPRQPHFKIGGEYRLESYTDRNTRGVERRAELQRGADRPAFHAGTEPGRRQRGFPVRELPAGAGEQCDGERPAGSAVAEFALGTVPAGHLEADPQTHARLTAFAGTCIDQGHEIWNRNSMFGPTIPNPSAGGLAGRHGL